LAPAFNGFPHQQVKIRTLNQRGKKNLRTSIDKEGQEDHPSANPYIHK
jgi:hypothetical protein